jgi:hypothetical protein
MNMREFTFGVVIFSAVLLFGTLFYTSMTTYYTSATVPTAMTTIKDISESSLLNVGGTATNGTETIAKHQTDTSFVGTLEVIWDVTNMVWGVIIMFVVVIPSTMYNFVTTFTDIFHLPVQFVQIIMGLIALFIIFEIISIIFKRET